MATRFQYIFLIATFSLLASSFVKAQSVEQSSSVKSEFLEAGISLGTLAVEGFPTTFSTSFNVTFRATEDFFLEFNYLLAQDVEESTFPKQRDEVPNSFDGDSSSDFKHFDLLLGYNLFQGEFFTADKKANLSSLYSVWGVGETTFANEKRFTMTFGLGYQLAFKRRYIVHFDLRDHIYKSSLANENESVHNIDSSIGLSYLF